jgi:hypothetical protein
LRDRDDGAGARARDLQSRNGTVLDGVAVLEAFLRAGSFLRLGKYRMCAGRLSVVHGWVIRGGAMGDQGWSHG